jgi:hypothetical protein
MAIYKKYSTVKASINTLLAPGTSITADKHRQVEQNLLDFAENQWLPGDIKKIFCTSQYIANNFDINGKGNDGGPREGWQICNGNNGTKNHAGRVSVAYGNVTPLDSSNTLKPTSVGYVNWLPVTGGSKNAVLVSHTHDYEIRNTETCRVD